MIGDNIAERLLDFGLGTIRIVTELPQTPVGKHISRQLVRCGTAGGAHYEEARAAESRADFAHKVSIAAKEVGESTYWLRMVERAGLNADVKLIARLLSQGKQLVAILKSSSRTAKNRSA